MPSKRIRIIFIGDVIGRYGRQFLKLAVPSLRQWYIPDLVVVNGENAAGGLGLTEKSAGEIFAAEVDLITTGNHIWDKREALELLKNEDRIIRPLNFHPDNPGRGFRTWRTPDQVEITVINLQGRVFMDPVVDNPFTAVEKLLADLPGRLILVDFHAEATAEKQAMGFFLDGRVSAVLGTHTHVPTADDRILPKGTAFQSDVGMTGSLNSIIGMKKDPIVTNFIYGTRERFEVEKGGLILDFTMVELDVQSGKALSIEKRRLHESDCQ